MKLKLYHFNLFVFFSLFFTLNSNAQSFQMSSVGVYAGVSSLSNSIQFKGISTCLDVQTGVAVLSGMRNSGEFAVNCEVTLKINTLGVKMYPVPVQNQTRVKFLNTPPLMDDFNLTIWSLDGIQLFQKKESGYNIFQGVNLDVSTLPSGTYVLKIESTKYLDALKFIKVN